MARPEPNVFSQKCGNGVVGAAASIVRSTGTGAALCAMASGTSVIVARKAITARSLLMEITPLAEAPVRHKLKGLHNPVTPSPPNLCKILIPETLSLDLISQNLDSKQT